MSLVAVCELVYRVKAIKVEVNTSITTETDPINFIFDEEVVYDSAITEITIFKENAYGDDSSFVSGSLMSYEDTDNSATVLPVRTLETTGPNGETLHETLHNAEVYDTEDGNFYLSGGFVARLVADFAVMDAGNTDTGGTPEYTTASLILKAGTFTLPVIFTTIYGTGIVSSNLTMTATKWFPYATAEGDPAWDTATGLPINGGPGA